MLLTEGNLRKIIREEIITHQKNKLRAVIAEMALLNEGIYDPGILKAVFMAGGPGSGKSYTAKEIFQGNAIEDSTNQAGTAMGLRIINSDPAFEMYLRKAGVDPGDLGSMPDEEFKALTEPADSPRGKASKMKKVQQGAAEIGRLGMIIDGTGDDLGKVTAKRQALVDLGYDTFMVFVNTSLEKALERNSKRDRVLPDDLVEEIWTNVQANKDGFEALFGDNMVVIDNDSYTWDDSTTAAASAAQNFVTGPIENPVGREWVEDAMKAKGMDLEDPVVARRLNDLLTTGTA